jgi:hypothetical protein
LPSRWKETLEVPVSRFFGVGEKKNEKGTKKAGASSNIQRIQAREAQKLKRAMASLRFETQPKS